MREFGQEFQDDFQALALQLFKITHPGENSV